MSKSSDRHARETAAKVGESMSISRESIRKAKVIRGTFTDGEEAAMSGEYSLDELYRLARGDHRKGLYLKIPPEVYRPMRAEATRRGLSIPALVLDILTQIFGGK